MTFLCARAVIKRRVRQPNIGRKSVAHANGCEWIVVENNARGGASCNRISLQIVAILFLVLIFRCNRWWFLKSFVAGRVMIHSFMLRDVKVGDFQGFPNHVRKRHVTKHLEFKLAVKSL
mmetsp:Transcript_7402/g.21016  ORF Transcript_7402/g.21016 Transcript_7402/m.21016 type:complete len:119 (+) Transcript_7402:132-488(+)